MPFLYYPLELELRGRSVLLVGGGKVAARKLPELLACGASITMVAPVLTPAARRLLPSLDWQRREFRAQDVEGRHLVFACTDRPAVNAAVAKACRARGIPCNRADAADRGDFIVPGVIRRGDVTLAISTGGRAPGVTRHLKRKLGAVVGPEWDAVANWVASLRKKSGLTQALPYDRLAAAARAGGELPVRDAPGVKNVRGARKRPQPPVMLLGAGFGTRSTLTLEGAEALRAAEVVIHDRLVSDDILALIPDRCLRLAAEKRGHFESQRQSHINALMLRHARAGRRVVRLKGGDPFIFGRGWEEVLALEAAGIPWRVLPGVSAASGVPAVAGIPLTHRGVARSFAVASGMAYEGTVKRFPKADTLVLLMALFRWPEILPALRRAGYKLSTPAAAIEHGGLPEQRVCRSTLGRLHADTAHLGFDSPTLIVIGEVVGLAKKI